MSQTDYKTKAVVEMRDVKRESKEMYVKFVDNREALEKANQEVEKMCGIGEEILCMFSLSQSL